MGIGVTNDSSEDNILSQQTKHQRFDNLDALRGIAAVMVVLFHFSLDKALPYGFNNLRLFDTGVDLFFIISGFVIFMSIGRVKSGTAFAVKRARRLYPTYWIAVSLTFLLIISIPSAHYYSNVKPGIPGYLANLTMIQYYLGVPDIDGPYWTLTIELLFYLWMFLLFKAKALKHAAQFGVTLSIFAATGSFLFSKNPLFINLLILLPLLKYIPLFTAGIVFYQMHTTKLKASTGFIFAFITLITQVACTIIYLPKYLLGVQSMPAF